MRKAVLYYTQAFLAHQTGRHAESPDRLRACISYLASRGALEYLPILEPSRALDEDIERVHDAALVNYIRSLAAAGGGQVDPETVVSAGSFEAAMYAAGAAMDAAKAVRRGTTSQALALVRPPGHHATRSRSMGFCLFNNIAIAARHLIEKEGARRIAILDFDVHHGNGTQQAFSDDPRVLFVSFHRSPFYPGSGRRDDDGTGEGRGHTINMPLPHDTPPSKYLSLWQTVLAERVRPYAPEIVLVSAGFDNYKYDPIGGLNFAVEDFEKLGKAIIGLADETCGGKVASVLEGGYDLGALGASLAAYLQGLGAIEAQSK